MLELQLGLRTNNSGVVAFNALKRAVYTLLCADTMVCFKDNHPKTFCLFVTEEIIYSIKAVSDQGRTNNSGVVAFNELKRAAYTLLCADTMVCFKDNHPKTIVYTDLLLLVLCSNKNELPDI